MNLNGTEYLYITNLQGDIKAITDTSGSAKVQYGYDIWGTVISTTGTLASTLGVQNPMRYRDYYYDTQTGSYYLQSRYYGPQMNRFVNPDSSTVLFRVKNMLKDFAANA